MRDLKSTLSFFQRLRQWLFRHTVDWEIFQGIFPHLEKEAVKNYPFDNDSGLAAESEAVDPRELLELIERQIRTMPKAYGDAFRYVMRRDLHARLTMYARLAQRSVPRRNEIIEFARDCV